MITERGKNFIKQYLAGQSEAAISFVSVGVGDAAALVTDEEMQFELDRVPVSVAAYDVATNRIIIKTELPEDLAGNIREVALWTSDYDPALGEGGSELITTFDSGVENWAGTQTFVTTNNRVGADALNHTTPVGTGSSSTLGEISLDFTENNADDNFVFAYHQANTNASVVRVRFRTDVNNYYEFNITSTTSGYNVVTRTKGDAVVVGVPDWEDITSIFIHTVPKSGVSADVTWNAIRINSSSPNTTDYGMIARTVLPAPVNKEEGVVLDLEYALNVTA